VFAAFVSALVAFGVTSVGVGTRIGVTLSMLWLFATLLRRLPVEAPGPGLLRRRRHKLQEPERRPRDLEELERLVLFQRTAGDLHFRLRPILRDIAVHRLAVRGVDLDQHRKHARALLGEELFDIVRSDRTAPTNRGSFGISEAGMTELVSRLEEL
jgi:hypothetical protein